MSFKYQSNHCRQFEQNFIWVIQNVVTHKERQARLDTTKRGKFIAIFNLQKCQLPSVTHGYLKQE